MMKVFEKLNPICFPNFENVLDTPSTIKLIQNQRITKIAKDIFFVVATLATTAVLAFTESQVVPSPITFGAFIIGIISWGIFYRLNRLENRYSEKLTDELRVDLAKIEYKELFHTTPRPSGNSLKIKINHLNLLLGCSVFDELYIKKLIDIDSKGNPKDSYFSTAQHLNIDLSISQEYKWTEVGHYGLPSFTFFVHVKWGGKEENLFEVIRERKEMNLKTEEKKEAPQV